METSDDTIIYGIHAVEELVASRLEQIERIYFDVHQSSVNAFELLKLCNKKKIAYQCVPLQKLDQIAGTQKHQGVVALCTVKAYEDINDVLQRLDTVQRPPVILVPACIEDPRNLGAVIRSCVAFGVFAILLERKGTTPLNATVAKASVGMIEHISIAKPPHMENAIKKLIEKGFAVVGADAAGQKKPHETDFTRPTVLITGGEHRGIPPYLKKLCTDFVGIPMKPEAQSLNISVAAAVVLYESAKQRNFVF